MWNLTVQLEAPSDATSKLQEVMDIILTEKRPEQTEKIEHMRGLPHASKQMSTGPQKTPPFGWQGTDL